MTEGPPTAPRWRRPALFVAAGALSAGVVAGGVTLASAGHQPPLTAAVRLAAATTGGAGADQAAVNYVDSHYPGPGAARVLKTEPDVERGVRVYDVRVLAPDATTYVVHVRQSNGTVLSANPAEHQAAAPPTTASPAPPATSPPATSAPPSPPVASLPVSTPSPRATADPQLAEPVETPEAPATTAPGASSTDRSPDRSVTSTGGPSPDHPKPATSGTDN